MLPKLGLRLGWKEALQSLTVRGVPTYLFSSGYGDVVSQVILQALYPGSGASAGSSSRRYAFYCTVLVITCATSRLFAVFCCG